jgi:4-hydroxythreonine-4-phosphate dehydrogenase
MTTTRVALTLGEPAGIGPDICLQAAQLPQSCELVAIGSADLLRERAALLNLDIEIYDFNPDANIKANGLGKIAISDVPLKAPCIPGELDVANSPYVLETLQQAFKLCTSSDCDAMVTAPIHKSIINLSGVAFSGHTEYLANLSGVNSVLMTFYTPELIVGLASTHLALNKVSSYLNRDNVRHAIHLLHDGLMHIFNITNPKIGVLGINPHAGESGTIGQEEQRFLNSLVREMQNDGLSISGPLSGDTAFAPNSRVQYDAILAMYHDQGLAPIKALYFGEIVNITLGLPFLRTSVDHGTALELAGTHGASCDSLLKAIRCAEQFCYQNVYV